MTRERAGRPTTATPLRAVGTGALRAFCATQNAIVLVMLGEMRTENTPLKADSAAALMSRSARDSETCPKPQSEREGKEQGRAAAVMLWIAQDESVTKRYTARWPENEATGSSCWGQFWYQISVFREIGRGTVGLPHVCKTPKCHCQRYERHTAELTAMPSARIHSQKLARFNADSF